MRQRLFFTVVLLLAVSYHTFFRSFLFTFLGLRRNLQQIEEFPYKCHRLEHPSLSSCEDIWLDEESRTLYAACGDMPSRSQWLPAANNFNASGRLKQDHVAVLYIDHPGEDGLYGLRRLEITGEYKGINQENENVLDLHGFGVRRLNQSRLQFFIINHRPPVNPTDGEFVENIKTVGANTTIEIFELVQGSSKLEFVKTIVDANLVAPNNVAWVDEGYVLVTNDHLSKAGKLHQLQSYYGSGNLISCNTTSTECQPVVPSGLPYANGVVQGQDGLIYVSQFITGKITAYKFLSDGTVVLVDIIDLKTPIDNLSIDTKGSIFAAGVPKPLHAFKAVGTGEKVDIPSTIFRIRNLGDSQAPRFNIEKVLEDGDGRILPGTTGVVHDVKTGKLFMGGIGSSFIAVCDLRKDDDAMNL